MAAMELLCHMAGVNSERLSKEESVLLETILFADLCNELLSLFKSLYKDYFQLLKNTEMEEEVMEANLMKCLINDIIATESYTLEGIAFYTQTHDEVIYEVVCGRNTSPSLMLSRKIIELHRSVRPELYKKIFAKILQSEAA